MTGHSAAFSGLCRRREDLPIEVFTIAGIQWRPFRNTERSFAILTPFRAQINRILVILLIKCAGFAPIFPDTFYHLTHYWPAAADIPVASDNPAHYADAIRYNARTPLQGSLLPLTRLV